MRAREWASFELLNSVTLTPGTAVSAWVFNPLDIGTVFDEPTIVRMIVNFEGFTGQQAAPAQCFAQWVISAWKEQPGLSNVTPVSGPDPINGAQDSMVWTAYPIVQAANSFVNVAEFTGAERYDLRSKRKLEGGNTGIAFSAANDAASTTNFTFSFSVRALFLNS